MTQLSCATCKHWDKEPAYEQGYNPNIRRCNKPPMWWDASEWVRDEDGGMTERKLLPKYARTMMFVQDGSDYTASLYTKNVFLCAHWEKRP